MSRADYTPSTIVLSALFRSFLASFIAFSRRTPMHAWSTTGGRLTSVILAGIAASALLTAPAAAQTPDAYSIQGTVLDATTSRPLANVSVSVRGTPFVTLTDRDGRYQLVARLEPGTYTVVYSLLGRGELTRALTLAAARAVTIDAVSLRETAVQLEEIIVTGTAAPVARRALGNAVSTVSGDRLTEIPAATIDQALQGKIAGAVITSNTGQPGGGVSVRLRGTSSIIGGAEPLYIVDGVIIDNNADQQLNLGLRSNASNRLADLDPDDIERVEVLKGAAAAALFGSRANNGVVQIFTRRGRAGEAQIMFGTNMTHSSLERRIQFAQTPVNITVATSPDRVTGVTTDVARFDPQSLVFADAWSGSSFLSVAGGTPETRYYVSANWLDQIGIMRGTDHERLNFRANLDQRLGQWFDLGVGANYIRSWTGLQIQGEEGFGGLLTAIAFTPTHVDLTERDPITGRLVNQAFVFPNPLEVLENWHTGQEISRFVGSLQARATPFTGVNLEYRLGYDRYDMETGQSIPRGSPDAPSGRATSLNRRSTLLNNDLVGSIGFSPAEEVRLTTSVGMNHTYQQLEQFNLSATDLVPGTRQVRGAVQTSSTALIELITLGFFGQEQIAWRDRLYLTGALRLDGSSTFGVDERWQLYPKVSGSWVMSEEPFWDRLAAWVPELRLRTALGYAGNQPPLAHAYSRLPRFAQVTNIDRLGLVPFTTPANPNLRPERQREWEFGFDAGLFDRRLGLAFTYYDQRTEDLLLPRPFTPSTGYSTILDNVGVLRNQGIELEVSSVNIDRARFGWSSTLTFARNRNRLEELFIDPYTAGYTNRIIQGHPLGAHFMSRFRRDDSGAIVTDSIGPVADPPGIVGNPWPNYTAGLANDLRLGQNWALRVLLDGSFGHELWNQTRRIMDIFQAGPLFDEVLQACAAGLSPACDAAQARRVRLQGIWESYLEDASYVKLRDLALRYSTDAGWIRSLGASRAQFEIVGRNLVTWTDYSGYDPEINMFGQSTVERGTDFAVYPNPRTIGFGVRLTY
jgi:TonB-dependent starch-binding outer membrane protein SusC